MTMDTLREQALTWLARVRPARGSGTGPDGVALGEDLPDADSCPRCGRPLEALTGVCPGCGARLVIGVQVRRAGVFVALGLVAGLLLGSLVATVVTGQGSRALPGTGAAVGGAAGAAGAAGTDASAGAGAPAGPGASEGPGASAGAAGGPVMPAVSVAAANALRQIALTDVRLAATVASLRRSLAFRPFDAVAAAQGLRELAADATVGAQYVPGLATWPAAATVQAGVGAFYDDVLARARDALAYSVSDTAMYRETVDGMVVRFEALVRIDAAMRALAASASVTLPVPAGSLTAP